MENLIARAEITINAPVADVWDALVNPELIRQYMFGTNVEADWREGGAIVWRGEWQGKSYEDKGIILTLSPGRMVSYSHYSSLSGLPDSPEYYHTVTVELEPRGVKTRITIKQENNPDEKSCRHSEQNWNVVLESLRKLLETGACQ